MNNYKKLLLKLNQKLEEYCREKESLEDKEDEIDTQKKNAESIEAELKKLELDLNSADLSLDNTKKNKRTLYILIPLLLVGAIVLNILYINEFYSPITIEFFISKFFGDLLLRELCFIGTFGCALAFYLNLLKKESKGFKYFKNQKQELLVKKEELTQELSRVRTVIASFNSKQIQDKIATLNEAITKLEEVINGVVEQENVVIAQIVEAQEPQINAEFNKNSQLVLMLEKDENNG